MRVLTAMLFCCLAGLAAMASPISLSRGPGFIGFSRPVPASGTYYSFRFTELDGTPVMLADVPEPATLGLFGSVGALVLAWHRGRRNLAVAVLLFVPALLVVGCMWANIKMGALPTP